LGSFLHFAKIQKLKKGETQTMKKILVVVLVVAFAMLGASVAMATVVGGAHDLSAEYIGSGASTNEVCVHCHTPHGGDTAALGSDSSANSGNILWNRDVKAGYNVGSSTCMGCHDGSLGTTLLNAGGSGNASASAAYTGGWANPGLTQLESASAYEASSHPINVVIGLSSGDWMVVPAKGNTVIGTVGGKVECVSCHEPHRSGNGPYLRIATETACLQAVRGLCRASGMPESVPFAS
jgi:predicted CXXCH cytochrome family protein